MNEEYEQNFQPEVSPKYEHYEISRSACTTDEQPVAQVRERRRKQRKRPQAPVWKKLFQCLLFGCVFGLAAAGVFLLAVKNGTVLVQKNQDETPAQALEETRIVPETLTEAEGTVSSWSETDEELSDTVRKYGTVAGVAQAVMPSIVAITSVSIQEIPSFFGFGFGYGYKEYPSTGSGSGIIVGENEEELLIATNNHVVSGASTLSVCFIGNDVADAEKETEAIASGYGDINVENAISAKIKGTDADNDLAVIAVNKSDIPQETLEQIKIAALHDADDLVVGEQVAAIGNALGYGQSLTVGYISALNRTITDSDGETTSDLIQTDAAINPGNSGGALLNMQGEVIGINSAKYAANAVEGMGYAIPVAKARPILEELMNRKTREVVEDDNQAAFLGVRFADLSSGTRQMYDIPSGAFIAQVYSGTAADKAGLMKGDVIERMDGQRISDKDDMQEMLRYYLAGEEVEIEIARVYDGIYQEQTMTVTFGSWADIDY